MTQRGASTGTGLFSPITAVAQPKSRPSLCRHRPSLRTFHAMRVTQRVVGN
jgi:hypothetical protein